MPQAMLRDRQSRLTAVFCCDKEVEPALPGETRVLGVPFLPTSLIIISSPPVTGALGVIGLSGRVVLLHLSSFPPFSWGSGTQSSRPPSLFQLMCKVVLTLALTKCYCATGSPAGRNQYGVCSALAASKGSLSGVLEVVGTSGRAVDGGGDSRESPPPRRVGGIQGMILINGGNYGWAKKERNKEWNVADVPGRTPDDG